MRFCVKSIPQKSSLTILALTLFKMPREPDVSFAGRFGHIIATSGLNNRTAKYPMRNYLHAMKRMHARVRYTKGRYTLSSTKIGNLMTSDYSFYLWVIIKSQRSRIWFADEIE
ncbi:uncharacterized protein AKAW2_70282A [Aspergillus luchuensis]|uniref:Uncharacterized protein n=1 Tax=Aspergillus kawachii TaxID=1069201 RepID=A0A7R7X579_ASPKA|nr:uncharacterized protein AKAW2_70282A [Aspergillus luchuensis]BCS03404.1 hypothetical protein AKAW2_70282A [Aspergillus luchuensis]BCS15032.1 hypothetical protein ALUC_70265A [Aspergillus luchuensis]